MMKQKVFVLLAVVMLTLTVTLSTVAGAAGVPAPRSGSATVSDDAAVQVAYEAYLGIVDAMTAKSYSQLETAYEAYIDVTADFTDEQEGAWGEIIKDTFGQEEALGVLFDASCVINTVSLMQLYRQTPTVRAAYKFVEAYDRCVNFEIPIAEMHDSVATAYATAKSDNMLTDDVIAIYKAYVGVIEVLEAAYPDDLEDAAEEFQTVVGIYNELPDSGFTTLAALLDLTSEDPELTDGEYISQVIWADWMDIQFLNTLRKAVDDYTEERNGENAETLVMVYEMLFPGDDEVISADLVYAFYPELDGLYEDAKAFEPDDGDDGDDDDDDDDDDDNGDSGDNGRDDGQDDGLNTDNGGDNGNGAGNGAGDETSGGTGDETSGGTGDGDGKGDTTDEKTDSPSTGEDGVVSVALVAMMTAAVVAGATAKRKRAAKAD